MRHLFLVENIDRCGSNWPIGETISFFFLPKNLNIWAKKSLFCMVIAIFVKGATTFPFGPPFFEAHPCFWPFQAYVTSL